MLLESLVVGLTASAAGVVAGLGLGWGMQRLFAAFGASIPSGPVVLAPSTVAIAMIAGTVVTVAAAVLPARSATRVAPVAALGSQHEQPDSAAIGWVRVAVAVVFTAVGLLVTYSGTQNVSGRSGFVEIAAGGCLCFVAVLALGPLIVPPVIAFLGWLPGKLAGSTVRLAAANARRNPHRVAATTAALTIGLTLMTVFTVVISSAQASSDEQITQHYPFDYEVQAERGGQLVPARVVSVLAASPALGIVAPVYDQQAAVNGASGTDVGAIGASALGVNIRPTMISGSLTAVGPGVAAVDTSQLGRLHVSQGGTLVVSTSHGTETLRVGAVYNSGRSLMPDVLLSVPDFSRGFRPAGAQEVLINGASGVSTAASRTAVDTAIASDPLLAVSTEADYRAALSSAVNQVLALFGTLLGLAILIALFGISNTLTLSVLERTRESALMRALGFTRGQLRRMLLTEALFMAVLAALLGVGLGAAFGWAMVRAFIKSAGGGVVSIPFAEIGLFVVIGAIAALLAAVLPARRAAQVPVISAMADVG
jgi:putative ABC transport system permease protein